MIIEEQCILIKHYFPPHTHVSDCSVGSCWVNGVHIATIKIRVTDKMRRDYKDYILFGGFGAVGVILFCIFCGVCCAQRNRSLR